MSEVRALLTVRCDEDYLRLVAYRMALRWIAGMPPPWEADPDGLTPQEMAASALEAFGDDDTEGGPP